MAFPLPSKKLVTTWFFLALIASAIGVFLWYAMGEQIKGLTPERSYVINQPNLALIAQVAEQDSDNDGLKDWEETLWKTNSAKSDTDGDGTSDGAEVKIGRDPNKAGPNDKLENTIASSTSGVLNTENLTETQIFSRQLFAEYLRLQQQDGGEISDVSQQYLVDKFLTKVPEVKQVKLYNRASIKIVKGNSSDDLRVYASAMGKVLKDNPSNGGENELVILKRALDNQDKSELAKIDKIIAGDNKTIKGFLSVTVPEILVNQHLEFLNNLQASSESIVGLRKIFDDPITTLANLNTYNKKTDLLKLSIQSIINFFVQKGVVFKQGEDGYLFTHII